MSETIVRGKAAVAKHFGVSVRQVRNWERAGMPGRSDRDYNLVKIQLWRDHKQGKGGEGDARQGFLSVGRGKDFQEERLKKAQADLKEMEVRRERGELIPKEDVVKLFVARIAAVKQGLLSLSQSLPPQLAGCKDEREIQSVVFRVVRQLLSDYSRQIHIAGVRPSDRGELHEFLDSLLDSWEVKEPTGEQGDGSING